MKASELHTQVLSAPKYWIYTLVDPRTEEVRYVGRTKHIHNRFTKRVDHDEGRPKALWVYNLQLKGLKPRVLLLESALTLETAILSEAYWIQYCLVRGARLLNVARISNGGKSRG